MDMLEQHFAVKKKEKKAKKKKERSKKPGNPTAAVIKKANIVDSDRCG